MGVETKIEYVYILGASHSGSTLLAMLLNAHPDVTTIGETSPGNMGDINTYRCSCSALIKDCSFWKSVTKKMQEKCPDFNLGNFGTGFKFPSNPVVDRLLRFEYRGVLLEHIRDSILLLFPRWKKARRSIMAHCNYLASVVLAESSGRIFVDSSKLAHRLKFLLLIPEFNIKVIHLVRDGRGVTLTYMRQDEFADSENPAMRRGGRGMEGQAIAASLHMKKAANEWRRCVQSAEHILCRLDRSQWIEIHYEELCTDIDHTLGRLFEFLGLDPDNRTRDFRSVEYHILGNGMRLDTKSEISLDERWRSELTEKDIQIFNNEAGEMNRRYGYV